MTNSSTTTTSITVEVKLLEMLNKLVSENNGTAPSLEYICDFIKEIAEMYEESDEQKMDEIIEYFENSKIEWEYDLDRPDFKTQQQLNFLLFEKGAIKEEENVFYLMDYVIADEFGEWRSIDSIEHHSKEYHKYFSKGRGVHSLPDNEFYVRLRRENDLTS